MFWSADNREKPAGTAQPPVVADTETFRRQKGSDSLQDKPQPFFPLHPFPCTATPQDPAVQHPESLHSTGPKG